jgi:endonuclease III
MAQRVISPKRFFVNVDRISRKLSAVYGDWDHFNRANPLEELLFIICSTQTNEGLYSSTFAALRRRYPRFTALLSAPAEEIGITIAHGGLSNQKAKLITLILKRLAECFGRPTLAPLCGMADEECQQFLISLPGVGKKTARCVMMYSLGRQVFPVDSNCWRICRRIGWVRPTRPDCSCSPRDMDRVQAGIPPQLRFRLHVNMVSLGRQICTPRDPRCQECPIRLDCRRIGVSSMAENAAH